MSRLCWYLFAAYSVTSPSACDRRSGRSARRGRYASAERRTSPASSTPQKPTSPKPAVTCTNSPSRPTDDRPSSIGTRLCVSVRSTVRPRYSWFGLQHAVRLRESDTGANRLGRRMSRYDLLVDQQFVVQPQVVAVGVELRLVERVDDDVGTEPRRISLPERIMALPVSPHVRRMAGRYRSPTRGASGAIDITYSLVPRVPLGNASPAGISARLASSAACQPLSSGSRGVADRNQAIVTVNTLFVNVTTLFAKPGQTALRMDDTRPVGQVGKLPIFTLNAASGFEKEGGKRLALWRGIQLLQLKAQILHHRRKVPHDPDSPE